VNGRARALGYPRGNSTLRPHVGKAGQHLGIEEWQLCGKSSALSMTACPATDSRKIPAAVTIFRAADY
jgi:hypothetical protein